MLVVFVEGAMVGNIPAVWWARWERRECIECCGEDERRRGRHSAESCAELQRE